MILAFLFYLCCSSAHSQDFVCNHIDWSKLDDSLTQLEWNMQQLQADNQSLQKYSEEMAKYSANQALQLTESEARSQSFETLMRRWRTYSLVITTVAISEGFVIYLLNR